MLTVQSILAAVYCIDFSGTPCNVSSLSLIAFCLDFVIVVKGAFSIGTFKKQTMVAPQTNHLITPKTKIATEPRFYFTALACLQMKDAINRKKMINARQFLSIFVHFRQFSSILINSSQFSSILVNSLRFPSITINSCQAF